MSSFVYLRYCFCKLFFAWSLAWPRSFCAPTDVDVFCVQFNGYVTTHRNGWSSFWIETSGHIRNMFISSVVVFFEHCINGLMLPVCYLVTHDDVYLNVCLYSEVGYMVYATVYIMLSYAYNKDVTVEQMHRSVWPLLLVHHISSLILCIGCIYFIEAAPKDLICWVLLALLGLTSSLHYVAQILDFSPFLRPTSPG